MTQKCFRRWIFVKATGRFLRTKILKTVSRSSSQIEYTHRRVYYMDRGMLHSICSLFSSSWWTTTRATSKYGWMTAYFILRLKMTCSQLSTLFFKKWQRYGSKLHSSNCVLLATMVRYCGRLITKNEVRFYPKNMQALQTMREPQNGADLVRYVVAIIWMRIAIPNYSKRVALLQAALAKGFKSKGRRTKKASAAVSLLHL
jgi:hypothetical protein